MKSSSVFRKFILAYFLLHAGAAVLYLVVTSGWIKTELNQQSIERLRAIAVLIRNRLQSAAADLRRPDLQREVMELGRDLNIRITIVSNDGEVLADSEPEQGPFENHSQRPEIKKAQRSEFGTAQRESQSVGRSLVYLAVRFDLPREPTAGGFVRVAAEEENFSRIQSGLVRLLWLSGLAVAGLSASVMWRIVHHEMQPLATFAQAARATAAGQFTPMPLALNRDDEWRTLAEAFRTMQSELGLRESRLLENSNRLQAVLSSMIEGVLAMDASGRAILANQAACKILSIASEQLLGRKLLEVVRVPALRTAVEETQLHRTFTVVEFETLTEPRKTISARVSVMPAEPVPGVAIVLHDVTEIRQLENMRSDFVANVSHELKTPLSSIKAYAETLKMGALNDPKNNMFFLHQIETQADLLSQQIHDLLTLARVESGERKHPNTVFPVDDICTEVIDAFNLAAESQEIDLTYKCLDAELSVCGDYEELLTVLNNLVSNAIRYTPQGGRVCLQSYADADQAVIEVSDTGLGIAPEHQTRIFERFYRVDRARSRELGGTGLGLSIVKHLTQSMGGQVEVESQIGVGSTFRIKLPRKNA